MPAQSKYDMLDKVKASLDSSKGFFVVDYRTLTVKETEELRREIRAAGGVMKVYKNNIVKIALKEAGLPELDETLVGTCAYVFFEKDPVAVAKTLKAQAAKLKQPKKDRLAVLGGIADGAALTADEAKAYAELPSYEELMAQLVYVIAAPMRGLMTVVNGPARGLALAMQAISEKDAA